MSTPYWGQLPPPQGRRLSQSSDQTDRRQSLDRSSLPQPRYSSNRASEQTNFTDAPTDSTYSPLASPTTSNAPGSGLTPRPPSLSYTQNQRHQELPENRARRTTRAPDDNTYRVANTSPLPAAPDAPKAHPASYTGYYRNSGSPYTDRPADQYSLPHLSHRQDTQSNVVNMEPETFYKDATPPAERQSRQPALDRAYQNFNDGVVSPEHLERELVRSGSIRRPPNGYRPDKRDPNSPRRRESLGPESPQPMWAADRSPLQKLELTLDSITKEEKRARVEAAERRARERAAKVNKAATAGERNQSLPERQAGQQVQVSNKDASIGGERSRHKSPASSSQAMPTAFIGHGVSPQNPSEVGTQYGIPVEPTEAQNAPQNREVSATTNGTPKRNLSFRERAATHERALPRESNHVTYPAAQTAAHGGYPAPVRSGSNKLKKNPPGDPWYTARREAEERSVQRSHSHYRRDAAPEDSYAEPPPSRHDASYATQPAARLTIDRSPPTEYARPPARGKTFGEDKHVEEPPSRIRELAAAIGFRRSNSMGSDQRPNLSESENTPILTGRNMQQSTLDGSVSHRQESTISGGLGSASSLNQSRPIPAPTKAFQGSQIGEKGTKSVKFQDSGHESGISSDHLSDATHQRHHLREYLHHDGLKPGQGTYRAPVYLDEWKQGTVGLLSGPLLDLTQEPVQNKPIQTLDKNTPWWEAGSKRRASFSTQSPPKRTFDGANDDDETRTAFKPPIYFKCGPLLRYCGIRSEEMHVRMSRDNLASNKEIWRGSVMIVTQDSESSYDPMPILRLFVQPIELLPPPPAEVDGEQPLLPEYVDPIAGIPKVGNQGETLYVRPVDQLEEAKDLSMVEPDDGLFEVVRSLPDDGPDPPGSFPNRKRRIEVDGEKLGKYKDVRGFRLHAERGHTFWRFNIEIELRDKQQRIAYRINNGPTTGFWVPARGESMNIMFYSCNGFSQSVNPDDFSGPDPMWRDVLNDHQTRPFHVMIGGGDQVYNDAVANKAKLFREWIALKNPLHKTNAPFTPAMQDELEAFYLDRYMMWFSQGLFGLASSQIPMVNMYDDHDIIDGFGSYPHHFMKSPVFSGLGNVAFKYYLLFQHQSIPNETDNEPSWCLGVKPGPYINQLSRSLFVSLGARVSLLAVDARTERTRDEVVHPDTWGKLMDRCYEEIVKGKTQHLLVLLGVPIAYPRLVWLENILTSRLMDPIKALGKFGLLGNLVNSFDGGVEVLDDLDDHWTAKNHKDERRLVIEDLQDLAVDKSIRVTILSGDVHLAAVGQFYSNPKLRIPKHEDFRYMLNVISSAIANTPPPDLMADVLNKRNKVHHFDKETDEDMMPLFADGVDGTWTGNPPRLT
ncbi:hypothetical protein NPX13_g7330 [Xylaria arbuscula]|uniref:PhoD-like phosphatase domain-containing protein n=1 Tax=Xylaria arbuscula TaxID=114810 RepID=A0A9W8NA80_9PEZI|nr:hypothetical protein NPX13_g7330 [Xylaria arbuscula]